MEKENNQQELLAKNLAYYRKASGLTQLELAEKLNYSDKLISKWERGEGFPDVFVLKTLADFYGITIDDFYIEEHKKITIKQNQKTKRVYIRLLSFGLVLLVTVTTFFMLNIFLPESASIKAWMAFIYGANIAAIVFLVWEFIYQEDLLKMIAASSLIWLTATSLYLTFLLVIKNMPLIFIVAAAVQLLEIIWFLFRRKKNKTGN